MYDPLSHLVYVTRGDDVQTVVVNGKIVMRNRKVLTLDEAAVLAEAERVGGKGDGLGRFRRVNRFNGFKGFQVQQVQGFTAFMETLLTTEQIQTRIVEMAARSSTTIRQGRASTSSACSRAASCSWPIWCAR